VSLFSESGARRGSWRYPAPALPMTRPEMEALGYEECDVVLVTGDAYVDHPSFGAAVIARVLEAAGYRVGILAQPDWRSCEDFRRLGRPRLFFGVTGGNLDSMVNRFTADRKIRTDDAYSPDGQALRRPERAAIVYAQRCREAFPGTPVLLGGIEASLRRIAHYDYWSERIRRSILLDAKADLVLFGNAERAVLEAARRIDAGEEAARLEDIRGSVLSLPAGHPRAAAAVRLPAYEECARDPAAFARSARIASRESHALRDTSLAQAHGDREVLANPPARPLSPEELDAVAELPYSRRPHPAYAGRRIPAWETVRHSVIIVRGCFGGCSFCSLWAHEGRVVQSRTTDSVLREIEKIRDGGDFTGTISDLGGPTANMYSMGCSDSDRDRECRRLSCLYPKICPKLNADHGPLIELYRRARSLPGVRKVLIGSGVRHDLALTSPQYVRELCAHHVGGHLKIAPEHVSPGPLACMQKPGAEVFERFLDLFARFSREAGKEQYLVPYLIAAHPGTTDEDMLELALWLKKHRFRPDQVQTFLPSPMTIATAMYATGRNPLREDLPLVTVPRGLRARRLHKAFIRFHDRANGPLLREALRRLGRTDLIGSGREALVPPAGGPPPPGAERPPRRDHRGRRDRRPPPSRRRRA
jgi:uncharacterized radical SAM protein YgiQ